MLCPNLDDARADLVTAANIFRRLTAFAGSCESAQIGSLSPQPQWITDIIAALKNASQAAGQWYQLQPQIISAVASAFVDYKNLFAAAVQIANPFPDTANWIESLQGLQTELQDCAAAIAKIQTSMDVIYQDFQAVNDSVKTCLDETWKAHDQAYLALSSIAYSIGQINTRLQTLTQDVTEDDLSEGMTLFETVGTVALPIFTGAAEAIPFVSIGLSVFGVGQSLYSTIVTDSEINQSLAQLTSLMEQQSAEVQAIGASNAALTLLTSLEDAYTTANQHLPRLSALWEEEAAKVGIAIEALQAGADPSKMDDLVHLADAQPVWVELGEMGNSIATQPVQKTQAISLQPGSVELNAAVLA